MKKFLALMLAVVMCVATFAMSSCGKIDPAEDWDNIKENGEMIVGYTLFEPMNYKDDAGKFIGFDTEYAEAVGKYLGVKLKFQEITWSQKYIELDKGKIDCIWNGFTSNSDDNGVPRSDSVDFTTGYATNFQCVVVNTDKINPADIDSLEDLAGKSCAVEGGSAGEALALTVTTEDKLVKATSQINAFNELQYDRVDFIIVDVLLANRTCGKGGYDKCAKAYEQSTDLELYAIGCRNGSTLTAKINEATKALMNDGEAGGLSTLETLSLKYGVPLSAEVLALKEAN